MTDAFNVTLRIEDEQLLPSLKHPVRGSTTERPNHPFSVQIDSNPNPGFLLPIHQARERAEL